jgi:hypothetical protein
VRLIGHVAENDDTLITDTTQQEACQITRVEEEAGDTILYFYSSDFNDQYPTVLIEIYRQQEFTDPEDRVYYEVGPRMTIDGAGHNCDVPTEFTGVVTKVDQDTAVPTDGVGVIDFGNSYIYPAYWLYTFDDITPQLNEDMVPIISRGEFMSSYLTRNSAHYGQGRANYSDSDEFNRDYRAIMAGGTYKDADVEYNELNKFTLGENTEYLNEKHGPIYAAVEMGRTLYAFQRSKVTALRLYEQLVDSGNGVVSIAGSKVFNSIVPFEEDFGTLYPGSITKYGRVMWFYDPINASVFQLAQNGLTDVSRYKYKSFFTDLSQTIGKNFTNYNFLSFYDIITETYVLIYLDLTTPANNWGLSYYPQINKWGCTENYKYEGGVSVGGNKVFSFNGLGYEHHKSSASFEPGYMDAHFNAPPLIRKLWRTVEIDAPYRYTTSAYPSVWVDTGMPDYLETDTQIHTGPEQRSLIPTGRYRRENGKWKASFLRNKYLNNETEGTNEKLYNGDRLAGKHVTVRVTNAETTYANPLRAITVGHQRKEVQ